MFDSFLLENWFDILQSFFIVGGFILSYFANRNNIRSRKVEYLFQINQSHREIWGKTYTSPELLRVKAKNIDLQKNPVTEAERRFVIEVIIHIHAVYEAISKGLFKKGEMEKDIASYLLLPIPNLIWQEVKKYYDKQFVSYVDGLLLKSKRTNRMNEGP